jgi:flavin reductase (DIM6/NTAB) family NADH-FMN oxidoreductase RutF
MMFGEGYFNRTGKEGIGMANAAQNLSSGMYLLTTRETEQDYGCLINSAMEVSRNPGRIAVCLVKRNLTHEVLTHTGIFNLCAITEDAPFDLFHRFGMTSSRKSDKFADFPHLERTTNGLTCLNRYANMYLSARVTESVDLGDHTLFIGEITDEAILSGQNTCTYHHFMNCICRKAK